MRVNPVIFLKTTKCAGTSVMNSLMATGRGRKIIGRMESSIPKAAEATQVLIVAANAKERFIRAHPEIWQRAYKFAVVRNPFDRAVSGWKYLQALKCRSLVDVLENPPRRENSLADYNHFTRPLSDALSIDGELIVDRVLRFEMLDDELQSLSEDLGIEFEPLPHLNRTIGRQERQFAAIDARVEELIVTRFKSDFEAFSYDQKAPCSKSER